MPACGPEPTLPKFLLSVLNVCISGGHASLAAVPSDPTVLNIILAAALGASLAALLAVSLITLLATSLILLAVSLAALLEMALTALLEARDAKPHMLDLPLTAPDCSLGDAKNFPNENL